MDGTGSEEDAVEIRVEFEGAQADRAFLHYLERRLEFALEPYREQIVAVVLQTARRSDRQHRATLGVQLRHHPHLLWIEEYAVDLLTALSCATARLQQRIQREPPSRRRRRPARTRGAGEFGSAPAM